MNILTKLLSNSVWIKGHMQFGFVIEQNNFTLYKEAVPFKI